MPPRPAALKSQTACRPASARSPAPPASSRLTTDRARMTSPRRSTRITRLHSYHRAVRPCAPHHYSPPRGSATWGSCSRRPAAGRNRSTGRPPHRDDRFTRSAPEPGPSSRHLHAGHHLANKQAPARLLPGLSVPPGFDVILLAFRHVISGSLALAFLAHTCRAHARDFSADAQHERLLTAAPRGGLRPPPAGRSRRTTSPNELAPPSPMQHRTS